MWFGAAFEPAQAIGAWRVSEGLLTYEVARARIDEAPEADIVGRVVE